MKVKKNEKEKITVKGTYSIHIDGFDWGCGTSKIVLALDHLLDKVSAEDFNVTETKQTTDWTKAPQFPVIEATFSRQILAAYLCDKSGNKTAHPSKNVALELYVSPEEGSPLLFSMTTMMNSWSHPYYLTITKSDAAKLTSNGIEVTAIAIDQAFTHRTTSADIFKTDVFEAEDHVKYAYAYYEPKTASDTLVVWLHGLGEGGTKQTDAFVTILANKVTALAGREFQETLGNAYILAPQCPTYWMDQDGKATNFSGGAIHADGTSFYMASLTELIDNYQEKCGASKVIIAGCSNGGYMTLLLAMAHGQKYDAYVPICEAVPDSVISDEQIAVLAQVPLFFIYSKDDTTVDPTLHEMPTIKRIKAAGAKNLHVSTTEHVIDLSGKIKDAKGNPYQYNGHWSWIYFDNNDAKCDECQMRVWEWMAKQVK